MYEEYFGFSKKPFSIVPDPHYFFLSAGHAEALTHLLFGINSEGGFVLLTGDVGTGKTTACRRLLETLPEGAEVAFILNPELSMVELLVSICREFGISPPEGPATNQTLVSSIHDYLLGVQYRLSLAGDAQGHMFPPTRLKKLYGLSRGVPRLINVICDRALLGAFVQEKYRVDPQTLKQAAREPTGRDGVTEKRSGFYPTGAALLVLFLIALGSAAFLYGYRPWSDPQPAPATASRPSESKPPAMATTDLRWPGDLSGQQTRLLAHSTISNLWHLEVKTGDLCEEADNRGLRCLQGRGSFTQLRQMNQPVILTLVDEKKGAFYAALTNLRGKTANVVLGTEPRVVELEEINRIWSGEYLLLWRVPPDYRGEVKPGSRGPMVAWLKQHLALAQGRTPPAEKDSEFDQTLVREVKRFQLSAGLVPDGIVGPMTIMPLNPATDTGDPVLHGGKGAF